ncbi:uncharacterized protein [Rutidosis leptorrhynchoides]|uniref:uncharacterized protein n=1 Tax=Rutidosis leptorrhynchoides TaxID=125765 RepID=UPI003A99CE6F
MTVEAATTTDEVITGMFLINSIPARVLFDCGANKSFMSLDFCVKLNLPVTVLPESIRVEVGDGKITPVTTFVTGVSIDIEGKSFPMTCLVLPIPTDGTLVIARWERGGYSFPLISMMKARKSLSKGCESFLAYVVDGKKEKKAIADIPVVLEFPEVFPDELPGLPPVREVEYKIELVPGATPVAKAPYRLAPSEVREMMSQIQELLDPINRSCYYSIRFFPAATAAIIRVPAAVTTLYLFSIRAK